ncbi:MAG: sigma-54-dependent Fis family transcriptional regulator [Deltaproteobacteria bacterium]|nr:sigma-54-dependent Fis family transcriptional regulator [Deltaproteobacteria bacterium]
MYKHVNLLIVDDDEALVKVFERVAKDEGLSVAVARTGTEALERLNREPVEVAVIDINLPGYSGIQLLEYLKANNFPTEVVIITGVGTVETAVKAIKMGAYEYLTKPFEDITKVILVINKALEKYHLMQKIRRLERQRSDKYMFEGIVGKSRKMQEVFNVIESIAGTMSTALILGESGTGKELVAQAIHRRSKRAEKPFVVINCAAIPEQLLESELFGHRKGSFTGAIQDKKGLFEEANNGTIFLDEIGDLPVATQVKLLRVLQEGEIRPVGGNHSSHVDVRLIAATNRDLEQLVREGKFREDLYYRLNVISINLPPLRERNEDIPLLTYHFLQKYSKRLEKSVSKVAIDALQALQNYSWVGNVRELENVIERAAVLVNGDTVTIRDLPPRILGESFYLAEEPVTSDLSQFKYQEAKERALWAFNRAYLGNLLRQTGGNLSYAAAKAGMDRSNFKKIVRKFHVDLEEYKKKQGQTKEI